MHGGGFPRPAPSPTFSPQLPLRAHFPTSSSPRGLLPYLSSSPYPQAPSPPLRLPPAPIGAHSLPSAPYPPPAPLRAEPPAPWPRCHGYGGAGRGAGNARPYGAQRAPRRAGSECAFPAGAARGSASLPAAVAAAMKDVPGFLQQSQSAGPGQAAVWHRLEELYNKK